MTRQWLVIAAVMGLIGFWRAGEAGANGNRPAAKKKEEPPAPPPAMRPVVIAKVDINAREQALAAAARIDRLVEANYAKYKVQPNPAASDEAFVRRAYLEITGTI